MLSSIRQDLQYGIRSFSHAPGLVAAIVISIGLGIGANTTVFSIVNELLLRPIPVRDASSLVTVGIGRVTTHSMPDYKDLRDVPVFQGLAVHCPIAPANLNAGGAPERVWGQMVSGNYFDLLGVPMVLGRGVSPDEDAVEGRSPVVVLGHGLWQRLGGDRSIIGRTVRLNGNPYTVIGVTTPGFLGTDRGLGPEFWAPLAMRRQLWPDIKDQETKRTTHWLEFTGRLKPGVTREQATAALDVIVSRVSRELDKSKQPPKVTLIPAGHIIEAGNTINVLMTALMVVVGLVLLIACANVANLLLARAATRRREMGIRLSMGAGRARVLRQLLTESVMLSLAGSAFGFLLAVPGAMAMARFQPPIPLPIRFDFSPDLRVFAFTTALAVITGIVFGFAPALQSTRGNLIESLRTSGLGTGGSRHSRLGKTLVAVQVCLSLVLLVASGLFLRSLNSASSIDIGMRPEGVFMMAVDTKSQGYPVERTARFFQEAERRLAAIPGVQSVAYSDLMPLSLASNSSGFRDGSDPKAKLVDANEFRVGGRYFETMGIPIRAGRDFTEADAKRSYILINQTMAASMFGNANPIGRHVTNGDGKELYEVIGVVAHSKAVTLGEDQRACMFRYLPTDYSRAMALLGTTLMVRTTGDTGRAMAEARRVVESIDRDLAVFNVDTMTHHVGKAMMLPRVCATLFGVFGAIGLVLASVGLYGVVNYSVRTRTKEIGIRLALGAKPSRIASGVARQGLILVIAGVAFGLGISFALSRYMTSLLYGVTATDPFTFAGVPLVLIIVALLAIAPAALRAARLEPMSALRDE